MAGCLDLAGGGVFETKFIENRIDIVLRRANLLYAPDIRRMLAGPILDALALGRTNAVDVRRGNGDGHAAILFLASLRIEPDIGGRDAQLSLSLGASVSKVATVT